VGIVGRIQWRFQWWTALGIGWWFQWRWVAGRVVPARGRIQRWLTWQFWWFEGRDAFARQFWRVKW
jgi:hypothetical protein